MMKNRDFRTSLGLTQEEAAFLLKITKSQLGMYELSLRDLPATKMLKLVLMHNHVQKKLQEKVTQPDDKSQNAKCIAILEHEYKSTKIEIHLLKREMEKIQTKYQKSVSAGELALYLETELQKDERPSKDFIQMLRHRAKSGIEKYGKAAQLRCELKLKAQQQQQEVIKNELDYYKQQ